MMSPFTRVGSETCTYGMDEKKHPLPIYTFMRAIVTTIATICNNHISLKNDRSV